jgi:hypothetical protein
VSNLELRKTMGAYNRQQVEDYYIDNCASRYASLFERTVQASASVGT